MAPTYLQNLSHFTVFLTAYTHTLLYLRELYPRTSFAKARFHNAPVYQSRHPYVCEWITDAIRAVREELINGTVAKIGIVVFSYPDEGQGSGSGKIMERYMFDVSAFPVVVKGDRNIDIEWDDEAAAPDAEVEYNHHGTIKKKKKTKPLDTHVHANISEQYRAALVALTMRAPKLEPLPPNCSFNISMELKDEGDVETPTGHTDAWVPVQPSLQTRSKAKQALFRDELDEQAFEQGILRESEGADLGGIKVTPIRSVQAGVFWFENWIEEGKAKFETEKEKSTETSFSSIFG
ncbi:hypothetical protein G6011_09582 [Alternaria panax]|uniref:HORMA domain-containing protein n=1 Tax=Alternaria panax TaxID=48097 RepID=A0AAD4F9R9_9PLEO|nr:hypothetical protein G6011_09582 [Alternaria panax]